MMRNWVYIIWWCWWFVDFSRFNLHIHIIIVQIGFILVIKKKFRLFSVFISKITSKKLEETKQIKKKKKKLFDKTSNTHSRKI